MAAWTRDEHLKFEIAFALKKVTIPGFRKALNLSGIKEAPRGRGDP